jgi:hypothetical protein
MIIIHLAGMIPYFMLRRKIGHPRFDDIGCHQSQDNLQDKGFEPLCFAALAPQASPLTTWVILLSRFLGMFDNTLNDGLAVRNLTIFALIGNRTRVYGVENRNSTTKL